MASSAIASDVAALLIAPALAAQPTRRATRLGMRSMHVSPHQSTEGDVAPEAANGSEQNREQKLCRYCALPIPKQATKCTHCNGIQNTGRYLNLSSNILSLLIALIAVAGAVFPILKEQLTAPESEISVTYQYASNDAVYVWVTNSGARSGSLGTIRLAFPRDVSDFKWLSTETNSIVLVPAKRNASNAVAAQSAEQVAYASSAADQFGIFFRAERVRRFKDVYKDKLCSLDAEVFGFDGKKQTKTLEIACNLLFEFVEPLIRARANIKSATD
jgi:hypothetical protein